MRRRLLLAACAAWLLGCGGSSQGGTGGSGIAAGGSGGSAPIGGNGGSPVAGTGGAGGAAACSPCEWSFANLTIGCDHSFSATCVSQATDGQAGDGTRTSTSNMCFSDGTKLLETDTYARNDAGTVGSGSVVIQMFKNGAICSTVEYTVVATAAGQTQTVVGKDASGNVVATLNGTATMNADGSTTLTETITCAGQAPAPFLGGCTTSAPPPQVCPAGACM
jgi:hypothetical protein